MVLNGTSTRIWVACFAVVTEMEQDGKNTVETSDYFAPLREERHMSLATFRRNGEAVPTPIWFAEVGGRLYVRTASHFKKLERIAHDPRVTVAPCSQSGEVTGAELPARARILAPEDPVLAEIDRALETRYARERPAMNKLMHDNGWTGVFVVIEPPESD